MKVAILWMSETHEHVHALAYDNGAGPVRTYEKDRYDARLDLGRSDKLPLVSDRHDVILRLLANRGVDGAIQVPINVVRSFGFEVA